MNEEDGIVVCENNEFLRLIDSSLSHSATSIHKTHCCPDCNCVSTDRRRRRCDGTNSPLGLSIRLLLVGVAMLCALCCSVSLYRIFMGSCGNQDLVRDDQASPITKCLLVRHLALNQTRPPLSFMCRCEPSELSEPSILPAHLLQTGRNTHEPAGIASRTRRTRK